MLVGMEQTRACAVLARAPGLKAEHVRAAVARYGSLEAAAEPGAIAAACKDTPPAAVAALSNPNPPRIDADLQWLERQRARLIPCTCAEYPQALAHTEGAPAMLYVLGDAGVLNDPQIAIVGSRSPSVTGRATARQFGSFFARSGLAVTSGLALGIDAAGHEGALLANGLTIAVCGNGLDIVYPRPHQKLAERIREHGALVSEFPPGTPPLRPHFPQRNRIISGLSLGTLVVEAAAQSGSLITAQYALDQGREVFAVPGSIYNPLTRGCHRLIRAGAKLVETGTEVLAELKFSLATHGLTSPPKAVGDGGVRSPVLDKEYEMLLDALGFEPTGIDALVDRTGLASESVASMLLILELEGRVAPHAGGRYCRLPGSPS
jgi:DNA processing protein